MLARRSYMKAPHRGVPCLMQNCANRVRKRLLVKPKRRKANSSYFLSTVPFKTTVPEGVGGFTMSFGGHQDIEGSCKA